MIVLPQRRAALVAEQLATATPLATALRRLREICEEQGRDPATLPINGRVYLGDGWERVAEEAVTLGCARLSVGFDRLADPGAGHERHLAAVLDATPRLDSIVDAS